MSWPKGLIEIGSSLIAIAPYGGPIGKDILGLTVDTGFERCIKHTLNRPGLLVRYLQCQTGKNDNNNKPFKFVTFLFNSVNH